MSKRWVSQAELTEIKERHIQEGLKRLTTKSKHKNETCRELNNNIWGNEYKIITQLLCNMMPVKLETEKEKEVAKMFVPKKIRLIYMKNLSRYKMYCYLHRQSCKAWQKVLGKVGRRSLLWQET